MKAKVKDVTVRDLKNLVALIEKTWVGDKPDRESKVRCGTLTVEHVDGLAELHVKLRFPLSL
jgi:hypothetical protein